MQKYFFKKCTSLLIALTLLIVTVYPVYGQDNSIQVQLNGENIPFDVAPQMVNNRVMVPVRTIFEKLGANVDWDGQTGTITITKDGTVMKLVLNSNNAIITKNGVESTLQLDTAPILVNDRTLVPVRFISEGLGKQVGWDQANRTVVIIDYDYFVNALKTQAPIFYEYASNQYDEINTGEIDGSADYSFKYDPGIDPGEVVSGTINADLNAKLNKDNGSMDAVIKISGLEEVLKGSGLENYDEISINILFDNNSFYIKSNLFSLLEQYNIQVGDKWIKADIADLGIPDVETMQDLKKTQSTQSIEQIRESLVNTQMELDVNSFKEAQTIFNALVPLVDNNHFKLTIQGDMKFYTWNIKKQDLVDAVLNLQKGLGSMENMSLEDLAEMKEFMDSLVFDFNMEVGIKNNIIVSSKTSLNTQMDLPDMGHFELSLKTNSKVSNPNNAYFKISMPSPNQVIDYEDLYEVPEEPSVDY
ncbi:MAG: hypothetical protein CVU89_01520 [Firmicutes bacterium HGW-Firmicutes-14]|nr:MAG: hypothetical protein CVU89_01520 [Firmicutes bacterium HGW-Firmicutes-14]